MDVTGLKALIATAKGEQPADLLLANGRIINTLTGEVERGSVAIQGEWIAGVGDYRQGREVVDLKGQYLAPGFINGHVHLESSYLHPARYAQAVVPRGTTTIITDLHEIANVAGLRGVRFYRRWARRLPLDFYLLAPSCVPATPMESSGVALDVAQIRRVLRWQGVLGLGEMMNFPGVMSGDEEVLGKIALAQGKVLDGHAPGLSGKGLNAYIAAGMASDHETTSLEEGREKLRRGMYLMIREGSSEKNLEALLPLVTDKTQNRCLLVVDDRTCLDLKRGGDMDAVVRKAIKLGLDPIRAIQLATINPAQYFGLKHLGAIAPGRRANIIAFRQLSAPQIEMVFFGGKLVAQKGQALFSLPPLRKELSKSFKVKPFGPQDLAIPAQQAPLPVIQVIPGQILTRKLVMEPKVESGKIVADIERDILLAAVVERHRATGNIGLGLVRGFGLKSGALASSIAHDSHNIVAVGCSQEDLFAAIQEVIRLQGGLVVARGGKALASLPLPIAGLLSMEPLEVVAARLEKLGEIARDLGSSLPSPFATLSFLALPVIPQLRLTDRGVVEV